jgi:hypothetical protein
MSSLGLGRVGIEFADMEGLKFFGSKRIAACPDKKVQTADVPSQRREPFAPTLGQVMKFLRDYSRPAPATALDCATKT